jgi:hypothetical protein
MRACPTARVLLLQARSLAAAVAVLQASMQKRDEAQRELTRKAPNAGKVCVSVRTRVQCW